MFIHNIFLANSFYLGRRIAFDLTVKINSTEKANNDKNGVVERFLLDLYEELGSDTLITTHTMLTESKEWDSVVKKDSFFTDIKLAKSEVEFKKYLRYNKKLTIYDIRLLLALLLKDNSNVLIDRDKIIKFLYERYLLTYQEQLFDTSLEDERVMPINLEINRYKEIVANRILASDNGFNKFKFIVEELKRIIPSAFK
ncbi:MAG: hypothetical protein AB9858_04950 [Acidaminococcaceae bacterium]